MTSDLKSNEIRFSNIGLSNSSQKGGFIITEDHSTIVQTAFIKKLVIQDDQPVTNPSVYVYKMFGLTSFGIDSINIFLKLFNLRPQKLINKYFHHLIMENMDSFSCSTSSLSDNTFSFNTREELSDGITLK